MQCSHSIEKLSLPLSQGMESLSPSPSLQRITFCVHRSQSVEKVSLPPAHQSLRLPFSFQILIFGARFVQSMEMVKSNAWSSEPYFYVSNISSNSLSFVVLSVLSQIVQGYFHCQLCSHGSSQLTPVTFVLVYSVLKSPQEDLLLSRLALHLF